MTLIEFVERFEVDAKHHPFVVNAFGRIRRIAPTMHAFKCRCPIESVADHSDLYIAWTYILNFSSGDADIIITAADYARMSKPCPAMFVRLALLHAMKQATPQS